MNNFDFATTMLHNNAKQQLNTIAQKIASIFSTALFMNGTFNYVGINMSWTEPFLKKWTESQLPFNMEKDYQLNRQFEQILREQYGFDVKSALLIRHTYDRINLKFPNITQQERNYIFSRLISQFSYNRGDSHQWLFISIQEDEQWRNGAGYVAGYDVTGEFDYFINILGFSIEDFNYLRFHVRLQNQLCSSTADSRTNAINGRKDYLNETKKWDESIALFAEGTGLSEIDREKYLPLYGNYYDSYHEKPDFSHMMYTISGNIAKEDAPGIVSKYMNFWSSHDERRAYIGWLGDATWTGVDHNGTSFSMDDILADLDAANISNRLNENTTQPIINVFNQYYTELQRQPDTRITEFLGLFENGYKDVEHAILNKTGVESFEALKNEKIYSDTVDFLLYLQREK